MKSNIKKTKSILSNNIFLFVPLSQRDYVWTNEMVIDFLNNFLQEKKFLGSFILKERTKNNFSNHDSNYDIFDGQQRITTIMMIYLSLYKYIKDFLEKEYNNSGKFDLILEKKKEIKERIIFDVVNNDLNIEETPILVFDSDERNNAWRENVNYYLYGKEHPPKKLKVLKNRNKAIYDQIKNTFNNEKDKLDLFFDFLKNLEKSNYNVVTIETEDDDDFNIYEIFEQLNSTGQKLSLFDLFKNYWFQIVKNRINEDSINQIQIKIGEKTPKQNFFVKCIPIIYKGYGKNKISFKDIKQIISEEETKKSPKKLLSDITNIADDFQLFDTDGIKFIKKHFPTITPSEIEKLSNLLIVIKRLKLDKTLQYFFSYLNNFRFEKIDYDDFYKTFLFLTIHQIINTTISKIKPNYIDRKLENAFKNLDNDFDFSKLKNNIFDSFEKDSLMNEIRKLENGKEYIVKRLQDYKNSSLWINIFVQTMKDHFSLTYVNSKNIESYALKKEIDFLHLKDEIKDLSMTTEVAIELNNKMNDSEKLLDDFIFVVKESLFNIFV